MDHAKSALPSLKTSDEKYEVLYLNTPWSAMSVERMEKLPLKDISADNAALFVWTDSYSAPKTPALLEKWGFKFHSVFQIMDIAQYPWMKKTTTELSPDATTGTTTETETKTNTETDTKPNTDTKTLVKKKATKKSRAPPVTSPSWWTPAPEGYVAPSRPTTEQLWLAVKGDPSSIFGNSTTAFNVVNLPEIGKKSRSKNKGKVEGEWDLDRPICFLDTVVQHVNSGVKVLDLFSTKLHDKVDSWGPGLPGGYLKGFTKSTGLVAEINKVMRTMKKSQLQCLSQKIPKMLDSAEPEKATILSTLEESFVPIANVLDNVKLQVAYSWKKDDGLVEEWTYRLVHTLAQKNVADFSSIRKKRKKRQSAKKPGNRPRHGIASPSKVSPKLADFLGIPHEEKIARVTVVKILNEYINKHSLKNPDRTVEILLDEPLKKLLDPPEDFGTVTFFNICKLVGVHFPKKTEEEKKADKRARDEAKKAKQDDSEQVAKKAKV